MEAMAIIYVKMHPVTGLSASWHVIEKETGVIVRDHAFSRYSFEIVSIMQEMMQDIIGACNDLDLRLTDIKLERR